VTDKYFKEHHCKCGCGIGCRATDPNAEKKIEAWKAKHKCRGERNEKTANQ
jgi:hypothetical protein